MIHKGDGVQRLEPVNQKQYLFGLCAICFNILKENVKCGYCSFSDSVDFPSDVSLCSVQASGQ